MDEPRCRMLIYGTNNIGDTVQAVALSYHLPQTVAIRRDWGDYDQRSDLPMVVQGFLNRPLRERLGDNCLFAGIYLSTDTPVEDFLPWLQASPWPIGVRDPWTEERLREVGLKNVKLVGCPTVTLPPYTGPRSGQYAVDIDGPGERLVHLGWRNITVLDQWDLALSLLEKYRTAELVTTNRLHVALPCLAFGTPLKFIRENIYQESRLSLLTHLGLKDIEINKLDLNPMAETYRKFLIEHMGDHTSQEPKTPVWESRRPVRWKRTHGMTQR